MDYCVKDKHRAGEVINISFLTFGTSCNPFIYKTKAKVITGELKIIFFYVFEDQIRHFVFFCFIQE